MPVAVRTEAAQIWLRSGSLELKEPVSANAAGAPASARAAVSVAMAVLISAAPAARR